MMRRVVVTGLGLLTPLGCGVEPTWSRLIKGDSGAQKVEHFDVSFELGATLRARGKTEALASVEGCSMQPGTIMGVC